MDGVRAGIHHVWDALAGSDPGLVRLHQAIFTALSMSGALALEFGLSRLTHADAMGTIVAMLLGTMVAMMGTNALMGTGVLDKVRTAALFPVAMAVGILLGALVGTDTDVMLSVFVAVMFVAVWVRRFGMAFFFYGFMMWMGYFFSSFLHATFAMIPQMMVAVLLGTAWVLLLAMTVTRINASRALMRVRRSFNARGRRLARACAYLLMADPGDRRQVARRARRVRAQRGRLAEAALMIDGWSAERDSLPQGWTAVAVRRRLVDLQLSLGALASGSLDLVDAEPSVRREAVQALWPLALRRGAEAGTAASRLREKAEREHIADPQARRAALRLAVGVQEYARLEPDVVDPPVTDEGGEFEPTVSLVMGNLPGSAAVVKDVGARGTRWNPLSRLDFTTRQAVQVAIAGALAIVFGRMLNEHRYYWAVIAAFVAFTGTGTRSETTLKATNRIIGTMVGLVAGILIAHLTTGHIVWTLVVVVASMSIGFYLIRVSYAYMIFFVTIMVAQLYSVLGEFSDELLLLRLKETALGGGIGILVGLLVTPLSTRDAVESVRADLLRALADFLNLVRTHLAPDPATRPLPDLDEPMRQLDKQLRALGQVGAPLTRPLLAANSPRWARHRMTLYAEAVRTAQSITRALRATSDTDDDLAAAVGGLAQVASRVAAVRLPLGAPPPPAPAEITALLRQVDADATAADPRPGPLRGVQFDVTRLAGLFGELMRPPHPTQPAPPPSLGRGVTSRARGVT